MRNRIKCLLMLPVLVSLPLNAVSADEHDAAAQAEDQSPPRHAIAPENLTLTATVTGRLEAERDHRLRLLPEAYSGPFSIEQVHHRGGPVKKGDLILTIDPTRLDESIETTERQLADQNQRLDHARQELAVLTERQATQLKQHEIALDRARTELDIWNSYHGPHMLKNAELGVRQMENWVSNQREELEQLEQMYEGTELDSETKEIVLERARRSLAIAEERLTISRDNLHITENVTHPHRNEDVNNDVRFREEALAHLLVNNAIAMQRKRSEIESLENSIEQSQRQLRRLTADRQQLTVSAPADGLLTPIEFEPDDTVSARQVIAHVHDPSLKVIRVELTAAELRIVNEGDTFDVRIPEYPELSLTGTVKYISPIGRAGGEQTVFDSKIHIAGDSPLLRLGLRATARLERTLENVLTVPRDAVTERDGRYFVTVDVDGEHDERIVTIGAGNDETVQVIDGLSEGDQVILPPAKD